TATPPPPPPAEGAAPTREMKGGNDSYNDRQVAKREHLTVAELLAEFEKNRAATIQAVEAADEPLPARPNPGGRARGGGAPPPPHPLRGRRGRPARARLPPDRGGPRARPRARY